MGQQTEQATTERTSAHNTPAPWSYRKLDTHFAIEAANGVRVADVRFIRRPDGTTSEVEAALIVSAVNAALTTEAR